MRANSFIHCDRQWKCRSVNLSMNFPLSCNPDNDIQTGYTQYPRCSIQVGQFGATFVVAPLLFVDFFRCTLTKCNAMLRLWLIVAVELFCFALIAEAVDSASSPSSIRSKCKLVCMAATAMAILNPVTIGLKSDEEQKNTRKVTPHNE